jgi:hypothetical protein
MDNIENQGQQQTTPVAPVIDVDQVRQEAVKAERERVAGIRAAAGDIVSADVVERAITEGWDQDRTNREFLRLVRERPTGVITRSDPDAATERDYLAAGFAQRGNILLTPKSEADKKRHEIAMDRGSKYAHLSLVDFCREALRISGQQTPSGDYRDLFRAAVSGGGLSYIFTSSINASLITAYQQTPDTTDFCAVVDRPNFLTADAIDFDLSAGLSKLPRGSEATHAIQSDGREQYKIARYAKQIVVDEQDIIDDRMDAFGRIPQILGNAAARVRPDLVYSILISNANLADGVALFYATTHVNATATALSNTALRASIAQMTKQTKNGSPLNIMPKYLVVTPTLQFTAQELIESSMLNHQETGTSTASFSYGNKNVLQNYGLQARVESRLENSWTDPAGTAITGAATKWFLFADPNQAPVVEVAYRTGTGRAPQLRSFILTEGQWGMGWDINLDIGAKAVDYRGGCLGNT